jgi:uncharacterized protein (DUF342 family)
MSSRLDVDDTGTVGLGTGTTTAYTTVGDGRLLFVNGSYSTQDHRQIPNTEEPKLRRKIAELQSQINSQQTRTKELQRQLEELGKVDFSKEELNFVLSRVHPDKNPNSNIAHQLTQKLIRKRNE